MRGMWISSDSSATIIYYVVADECNTDIIPTCFICRVLFQNGLMVVYMIYVYIA